MTSDIRWTATAVAGLWVGALIAGAAFAAGRFSAAGDIRNYSRAYRIAEASADSLVQLQRRMRCYASEITRDSLTALRLEAHLR